MSRKYYPPATPYERLLADGRVTNEGKDELRRTFAGLDPVHLLREIRTVQQYLAQAEAGAVPPTLGRNQGRADPVY